MTQRNIEEQLLAEVNAARSRYLLACESKSGIPGRDLLAAEMAYRRALDRLAEVVLHGRDRAAPAEYIDSAPTKVII
jgi:hypothetical protein